MRFSDTPQHKHTFPFISLWGLFVSEVESGKHQPLHGRGLSGGAEGDSWGMG